MSGALCHRIGNGRRFRVPLQIPTDEPESDGTYEWDSTTIVIVEAEAGGQRSLGYTYADEATAKLIETKLKDVVSAATLCRLTASWSPWCKSIRNLGRPGICSMAISAVDTALWDLKARLLGLPLVRLFGQVREAMPIYGSGGFTSYSTERLQEQLGGWVEQGIPRVKMKIGRDRAADPERVAAARGAIGDGSGTLRRRERCLFAQTGARASLRVFGAGRDLVRGTGFAPTISPGCVLCATTARRNGHRRGRIRLRRDLFPANARRRKRSTFCKPMRRAAAVTPDFSRPRHFCEAHHLPLSSHCAPALALPVGCGARPFRHAEYFHDHVRIERMFFDGLPEPNDGALRPDLSRPATVSS